MLYFESFYTMTNNILVLDRSISRGQRVVIKSLRSQYLCRTPQPPRGLFANQYLRLEYPPGHCVCPDPAP